MMEGNIKGYLLPAGASKQREEEALRENNRKFVALVPRLHYAVNRVLDESAPQFSRKVMVALWALAHSKREDRVGTYVSFSDLYTTFRDWYVVSENTAMSQVSKVKRELFDLEFIKIEGGSDHIHLTERGSQVVEQMFSRMNDLVGAAIGVLNPEEQQLLLDFAKRMMSAMKRRPAERESL
jgi:hypothetical protein